MDHQLPGYTIAIFNEVGVPLFSRSSGYKNLSLPQLGLIFAVENVSKNHIIPLKEVSCSKSTIVWRSFASNKLQMALITAKGGNEMPELLSFIFDGLVLQIGSNELKDGVVNEKISRQIKVK